MPHLSNTLTAGDNLPQNWNPLIYKKPSFKQMRGLMADQKSGRNLKNNYLSPSINKANELIFA
jgi:hypothetical protein